MTTQDESDSLATAYSAIADDSTAAGPAREAAMLYAVAESLLNVDEDVPEAFKSANDALKLFKEVGDQRGIADTTRLIINTYRTDAQVLRYTDQDRRKQVLKEAETRALHELKVFQQDGNRWGEAAMMLALADSYWDKSGAKKRELAAYYALEARAIFKELGSKQMEAQCLLALMSCYVKEGRLEEAHKESEDAIALCQASGDKKNEAKIRHCLAVAVSRGPLNAETFKKGLQYAYEALALERQLGLKKLVAYELNFIAKWHMMMGRPKDALQPAKESIAIFRELGYGKGWQAESQSTLVTALMSLEDFKGALRVSRAAVAQFRASGDKRSQVLSLESLIACHLQAYDRGDPREAAEASQEGVRLCKELQDKKWEANMLHNVAQVALRDHNLEKASEAIQDSALLFQELGDQPQRAVVLTTAMEIFMERNDLPEALEIAEEVRYIYREEGIRKSEAEACLLVSQVHLSRKDTERALHFAKEAQVIFQEEGDKRGEGQAWGLIVEVRRTAGDEDEAVRAARTAQALYHQAGDKKSQAYALHKSASLYLSKDRPEEAVRAASEAVSLARSSGDVRAEVEMLVLASQANISALMKQCDALPPDAGAKIVMKGEDRALRPGREAVALSRKMGDKQLVAVALFAVGQVHIVSSRTAAARQCSQEAFDLFMLSSDKGSAGQALLVMAEADFVDGNEQKAREQVESAKALFQQISDTEGLEKAQQVLQRFNEAGGRVVLASQAAPKRPESGVVPAASQAIAAAPGIKALDYDSARMLAKEVALTAIGSDEELTMDDPLMDLGVDSLAAIAFREELVAKSGLPVPSSLIFDFPSLHAISMHLVETSQTTPRR